MAFNIRIPPFRFIYLIRFLNAIALYTFFQPDEYFQSLEPAWALVFGSKSGAWLTWEWQNQLRSSLHPILFAGWYKFVSLHCQLLGPRPIDSLHVAGVLAAPRILQAAIAAAGDYYTQRIAISLFGEASSATTATILLQLLSAWQWYVSTRTFSNSLETSITAMALAYFPWSILTTPKPASTKENPKGAPVNISVWSLRASLLLAASAVLLRPTNVLIWLPIALFALTSLSASNILILVRESILCGALALAVSLGADRWYFGFWTVPQWRWLTFNISRSLAVFYGTSPWHYYLLQGLPLLCTVSLPFALYGLYKSLTSADPIPEGVSDVETPQSPAVPLRALSWAAVTTVLALSLISHKEVRFIYPLLPILNVIAAPHVASFFSITTPATAEAATPESGNKVTAPANSQSFKARKPAKSVAAPASTDTASVDAEVPKPTAKTTIRNRNWLTLAININIIVAGYLSTLHQTAPISVVSFLRTTYAYTHYPRSIFPSSYDPSASAGAEFENPLDTTQQIAPSGHDELFALFLTPCHSTPWRSHLIYPHLNAQALTCEPPLHTEPNTIERTTYRDEADRFYDAPISFLADEFFAKGNGQALPRFIVGFEGIEPWLVEFTQETARGKELGMKFTKVWSSSNGLFHEDWRRAGELVVWDTGLYEQPSQAVYDAASS